MNYVILDLEWNGCYSKKFKEFINEIIEFGAVKLDDDLNIIDKFSMFIRPEISRKIRSTVSDLTSITFEDLKHGAPFNYAASKFRKFSDGCILMTWSTSDLIALESNFKYHFGNKKIPFLKKYVDLQSYCGNMMGVKNKKMLGLVSAAEMLDIDIEGIPRHRAVGDSIVSAKCLKALYDEKEFSSYIRDAECEEFYDRLNFHNTYISDIDSPLIDKKEMFFDCNLCGAHTERREEWKVKHRAFYSEFECLSCGNKFKGKICFKQKYDGVTFTKSILPPKSDGDGNTEKS